LPLLPVAPVVPAALAAPLLPGAAGRVGRFGVLLAALGMLAVLLSLRTPVAVADGELVGPAAHALLSAVLLALAVGAAATFDALARREEGDGRLRRLLTGVLGVLVAAACLVSVTGWTLLLPDQLQVERVEAGDVPAGGRLIVHCGDSVVQHAAIADARDVDTVAAGEPVDADPASTALREGVAGVLSSAVGGDDDERATVSDLAVSYVVVRGDLD